jgi:hypothetical protein
MQANQEQEDEQEYLEEYEQNINEDHAHFISHLDALENINGEYRIEDMGNESPEQEYLMYIEDKCQELRDLINKLYAAKIYIIEAAQNGIEIRRDKLDAFFHKR